MSKKPAPLTNASKIIDRFGGIRPMAAKIDTPVTTVQGWKKRDVIPGTRREQIINAAKENNIDIDDLTSDIANTNEQESAPTNKTTVKPAPVTHNIAPQATPKPVHNTAHDQLLAKMEENSQKTMVASAWIAVAMILVAGIVGFFLLYPGFQKKSEELQIQSEKIESLETQVEEVENQTSFMQKIVPSDIQNKMNAMRDEARSIQGNIQRLSQETKQLSDDLLSKDAGPLSQRLTVVEEKLSGLSDQPDTPDSNFSMVIDRIKKLETSLSGQQQLKDSMAQLQDIVSNLDQSKENNLNEDLASAQENEESGALGQTLEGVSNHDLKAAAMLIAFSQLRDSLNREAPFENDLALLQKLAGKDNKELQGALDRLAPHAAGGVLTTGGLSHEFKGLAGDIVFSSLKGEDVSFSEKAKARIHNMLKVEKDGESLTGTQTQVTVSRAQDMLDAGNIEGAIAELQTLEGDAAQTAQPFMQQAQASLLAEQAKKMLGDNILSKISNQLPAGLTNGLPAVSNAIPNNLPTDLNGNINIDSVKEALEETVPTEQKVITDKESGLSILPRQQGFKGFSGGQ